MLLNKSERNIIRKRLNEIDRERPNTRQEKRLLDDLTKIFNDLKFKKDHINNAFDSSSYYGLKDLEYTFGDLDDYHKPQRVLMVIIRYSHVEVTKKEVCVLNNIEEKLNPILSL